MTVCNEETEQAAEANDITLAQAAVLFGMALMAVSFAGQWHIESLGLLIAAAGSFKRVGEKVSSARRGRVGRVVHSAPCPVGLKKAPGGGDCPNGEVMLVCNTRGGSHGNYRGIVRHRRKNPVGNGPLPVFHPTSCVSYIQENK